MRTWSCLTLALLVAAQISNSQAFKCHKCAGDNCQEEECTSKEGQDPESKFACSSAYFPSSKTKSCESEAQLQEIVANDKCENMTVETYLRWHLKTVFPSEKRINPGDYGKMTVEEYVSHNLKDHQASHLQVNVEVCSCGTELCNSDEEDRNRNRKLMGRKRGQARVGDMGSNNDNGQGNHNEVDKGQGHGNHVQSGGKDTDKGKGTDKPPKSSGHRNHVTIFLLVVVGLVIGREF